MKHLSATRREFLRRTAALSAMGVAGPSALNFTALSRVAAASANDYKALVCVFLYGANDHYNTFVPYDTDNYSTYQSFRPELATSIDVLGNSVLMPEIDHLNGRQYALAPQLPQLYDLWQQQELAVLLNVGPLSQPTSKYEYERNLVPIPPKIFSHNDQQSVWQTLSAEGAKTGWGGRIADLFLSENLHDIFTGISLSGNSVFLSGEATVQYQTTTEGSIKINPISGGAYGEPISNSIRQLITMGQSHLLKQAHADITRRSIAANEILTSALAAAPGISTSFENNLLSAQLRMVAQIIAAREQLGVKRQVFFVGIGGFDNHSGLLEEHPPLLTEVNQALNSFYKSTQELNISDQVTAFTASDFGRTLSSNGNGTDHGWGSHHMIVGGAVNGNKFYGIAPELGDNGADDVGRGRLLPTTSVEQMASSLGRWFGCSNSELVDIFPNLPKFDQGNLDFMAI